MRFLFHILFRHKIITLLILIAGAGGGYYWYTTAYNTSGVVRHVLGIVERGTLIQSISGSGQVSSLNQLDVKPKVSGDLVVLNIKNGDAVRVGAIIAVIDSRDAQKAVRDAEVSLASAQLSLDKLKKPADVYAVLQTENALAQAKRDLDDLLKPPDALAILQAENALTTAGESKQKSTDNLAKAYEDGFNAVANAFLDLPDVVTGLYDMLYTSTLSGSGGGQWNIDYYASSVGSAEYAKALQLRDEVNTKYQDARKAYDQNFSNYKSATRLSDRAIIETLLNETYETTRAIAESVKSTSNLIQYYRDSLTNRNVKPHTISDTHRASLNTYTGKTNTHLSTLLSLTRTVQDNKDAIVVAERTIAEKTETLDKLKRGPEAGAIETARERVREREESLAKLRAGADALDIRSQELAVQQRINALRDVHEKLADYTVRAPFDGIIAKSDMKRGDAVSSATVLATLIAKQQIAEIALNEVDIAKIHIDQKATFTFDALPNLSITGRVVEVDTVGTISQGVVTYTVTLAFDTTDDAVKPGMSTTATIITDMKTDVLLVPLSAVKTQGAQRFVEIPGEGESKDTALGESVILGVPVVRQMVETGMSNDDMIEVTSGIGAGDRIIIRTIQPSTQTQTTQTSLFGGIPGGQRGGGGGGG
ncbi:efflux RND transporter periplasmic adaptor subunit, partial [Candidatus Uhrbacteria bacterium]|nr:efflux RND transporter periplasmic adaptor subunit [Candidatus Uhrbacteria bacterium]